MIKIIYNYYGQSEEPLMFKYSVMFYRCFNDQLLTCFSFIIDGAQGPLAKSRLECPYIV